jgi:hypothetical protein
MHSGRFVTIATILSRRFGATQDRELAPAVAPCTTIPLRVPAPY